MIPRVKGEGLRCRFFPLRNRTLLSQSINRAINAASFISNGRVLWGRKIEPPMHHCFTMLAVITLFRALLAIVVFLRNVGVSGNISNNRRHLPLLRIIRASPVILLGRRQLQLLQLPVLTNPRRRRDDECGHCKCT